MGYAPEALSYSYVRATSSNRSSDDDDKIHKTEALLLELKTESPLYKGKR